MRMERIRDILENTGYMLKIIALLPMIISYLIWLWWINRKDGVKDGIEEYEYQGYD